ncbi:DnaJ domain protein [Tolypocladium paradoxum]|uniref:DnaJ domain protein n=1 Tax=Tolypocladium paradoxum TaxID=94208 RepID=A0A2S4L529_9HYPO|nr:DnaJ domain protein [Tolypocladium paradoxum]
MAPTRDYYGDLELPSSADIAEIKKQFRKLGMQHPSATNPTSTDADLALKYHPDRNPGREQEVNSKFQVIQSAHEILSDPQQKAKYDATLGRPGRVGGASGVKGNPWQNVSQQFPTPPRRNTAARNATSGAQRWQTRFSNGVPPTAKQQAAADPEAKRNAARAFENMRKNQSQGSAKSAQRETRPSQPPPPPPRTESARQRAQASFGARKTGFHPRSADPGDEPPVSSQSYYTRSSTERPQAPEPPPRKPCPTTPIPDPLSQFRDRDGYAADTRHATPYSSHGGEKTDPFDGVHLGRAKSSRESYRRDEASASDGGFTGEQEHRSSSVPKSTSKEGTDPGQNVPREDGGWPDTSDEAHNEYTDTSFKSRTNAKYNSEAAHDPTAYGGQVPNTEKNPKSHGYSGGGPSMYDTPCNEQSFSRSDSAAYGTNHTDRFNSIWQAIHDYDMACLYRSSKEFASNLAPSGNQTTLHSLPPFERQQHLVLDRLISNIGAGMQPERKRAHADSTPDNCNVEEFADRPATHSFSFSVGDDAFEQTSPSTDPSRFAKSSVDDINTQFVNDDGSNTWQFSAGNGEQDGNQTGRPPSGGRANRRSAQKRPTMQRTETASAPPQSEAPSSAFNANGWSDKFGPQTFVPQPTPGASASPTRSSRANSKKVKVKPTAGNAAVVDDSSSGDETYEWRGRNAQAKSSGAESPQAMDIDSPPSAPTVPPIQPGSARNIHVEPSRPEWRPGNVDGMTGDAGPERPEKIPINANASGSEDSEEFRASFADLKNVAPFAQQKVGLKSFTDLKDNLPFESKASEELPIKLPKAQPLVFPTAPEAPRLPPTVAIEGMKPNIASWSKYLAEFESYLQQWDDFNGQVVDHFATRKAHIARTRSSKGYGFLGARGDGDIQEYYNWVQQDNDVRQRWNAACDEHEQRFREFMAFREKMK